MTLGKGEGRAPQGGGGDVRAGWIDPGRFAQPPASAPPAQEAQVHFLALDNKRLQKMFTLF